MYLYTYIGAGCYAYACVQTIVGRVYHVPAEFSSSDLLAGPPSVLVPLPFPSLAAYFADLPGRRQAASETDRVFENVVACLATRPQLPNRQDTGDGDGDGEEDGCTGNDGTGRSGCR